MEWPKFDPAKSTKKQHIHALVKHRALYLLRQATAAKRYTGDVPLSLNTPLSHQADTTTDFIDLLSADDQLWGRSALMWDELNADLKSDVAKAIDELPPDLAEICHRLKYLKVAEVYAELNITRSAIRHALKKLAEILEAKGLKIYLRQ